MFFHSGDTRRPFCVWTLVVEAKSDIKDVSVDLPQDPSAPAVESPFFGVATNSGVPPSEGDGGSGPPVVKE